MTNRPICPYCKAEISSNLNTCPTCVTDPSLPPAHVVGDRSGLLDLLIHEYKYDSTRDLAPHLAALLDARLPALSDPVCLVPLPTATHHIRARGFDHTLALAKQLSRLRNYPVQPLLTRTRNTTQVGSNRSIREQQAFSAYQLAEHYTIDPSATYLLLDDVSTTGASILAATEKLRQAGASHIEIALLAVSS